MKTAIRLLLLLVAAVSVALNVGPIFTSGEINIGIIVGLMVAILCTAYAIIFDKVNKAIKSIWKNKGGKILLSAIALCVAVGVAIGGCTLVNVITHSTDSDKDTEYIIVLGCKVTGDKPGIYLRGRINKAYEYLTEHPDAKAILSGGQGSDEQISEGQCMYNTLTEMGIDPKRLMVEDESTSTIENFNNSIQKLKAQGTEITEITIVTNDFHEYRASKFAERCGLKAYSCPSKTPFIGYTPFAVREVFAIVWQVYVREIIN